MKMKSALRKLNIKIANSESLLTKLCINQIAQCSIVLSILFCSSQNIFNIYIRMNNALIKLNIKMQLKIETKKEKSKIEYH